MNRRFAYIFLKFFLWLYESCIRHLLVNCLNREFLCKTNAQNYLQ